MLQQAVGQVVTPHRVQRCASAALTLQFRVFRVHHRRVVMCMYMQCRVVFDSAPCSAQPTDNTGHLM